MMVSTHFTVQHMASVIQQGAWAGHSLVNADSQEQVFILQ